MSNFSANTVSNPSAVNTAAKDILARILAGENLIIEHDAKAHTAMFDTKNRVLTLPVWDNMSEAMYDMLIGHEVGHALFTPWTERDEAANGIAAASDIGGVGNAHIAMDYLNVVEDARIERMVQDKFPGLRRDFFNAYGEMVKSDFFGINGNNINEMPLIDRINIHFKLGTQCSQQLIFTPDEQQFIDRIKNAESFDDVTVIAQDLYTYCGNKRNDSKREEYMEKVKAPSQNGDGESESEAASGGDESNDDGEKGQNQSTGKDGNDPSKDGVKTEKRSGGNEAGEMSQIPARARTQQSMNNNIAKQRNKSIRGVAYSVLETPNISNIVWDYKNFIQDMEQHFASVPAGHAAIHQEEMRACAKEFNDFMTETAPIVTNMVKQFEMRKAADKAKRTSVSRSGVIDTVRMMNYKLTDDIFRRNAFVADGKSHGLVMYIDWSSSMAGVLRNTVKQLMLLTMFCRKVNIPFEVYAFTSIPVNPTLCKKSVYGYDETDKTSYWKTNTHGKAVTSEFAAFSLINFMSSRMKGNEYKTGLDMLYRVAYSASAYSNNLAPYKYGLGSTPLNECIVAAMDMVPKFREVNKLQIVNTVFLTDGESSGNHLPSSSKYYGQKGFIIDPVTKKSFEVDEGYSATPTLLKMFRDRTKTNAIGFFLQGNKNINTSEPWQRNTVRDEKAFSQACSSYNDNGFAVSLPDYNGYTEQYIIRSNDMAVSNANDNLEKLGNGGATVAQVSRALAKDAAIKNKSKLLLNRFIDLIAKA